MTSTRSPAPVVVVLAANAHKVVVGGGAEHIDPAVMAAGSTITEDVPEGALAVARARQKNVEGYADRSVAAGSGSRSVNAAP